VCKYINNFMCMFTDQVCFTCKISVLYSRVVQKSNNIQYTTMISEAFRGFRQLACLVANAVIVSKTGPRVISS
jgi:hypothetical protein